MGLPKGEILAGRFRVENFIDAGGMGAMYRVWDLQRKTWLASMIAPDLL